MELRTVRINPLYVLIGGFIMLALSLGFSLKASAHGYVDSPKSRAVLCEEGVNKDCGAVIYEPQSIEGPGNFPEEGVADGEIASGGGVFPKLDEQGEDRWAKVGMSSGANTFSWTLTAA
ncbi:MAG TPA: lytic polysaccharide monooxygenase, partial [Virgibacillus sp.]